MKPYSILLHLVLTFLIFGNVHAQNQHKNASKYAQNIIETLTSDTFQGRGYVDDGMNKTADFIAAEFEKFGLQKINHSYFQEFTMPINVIKNAELNINGKDLKYGIDFILKPNSKSQTHHSKPLYTFDPIQFEKALHTEKSLVEFIQNDFVAQENHHIIFPPHLFKVDSINNYYKDWPNFYRAEENRNRAIFFFTSKKLTSSLSQKQDSIVEFFIHDKYYTKDLSINHYLSDTEFISDFKTKNVIGKIEGKNKDSIIVFTSHFDHLGKVGKTIFPGASDNASGTAFMLELAKYFSQNQPKYSMVFIAFAAEEVGMIGSNYFVENPLIDLKKIKFLLNFDIMGAGEDGIQIVNSNVFTKEYELLNQINSKRKLVKQIKKRGEACNSDHCPFYEKGVPSFFVYTLGGPGFYHDPMDKADTLNLFEFNDLKKLLIEFVEKL